MTIATFQGIQHIITHAKRSKAFIATMMLQPYLTQKNEAIPHMQHILKSKITTFYELNTKS